MLMDSNRTTIIMVLLITRKERLMRKQTCLYLQTGLLSRILHLLKRGLADRSSLFILI